MAANTSSIPVLSMIFGGCSTEYDGSVSSFRYVYGELRSEAILGRMTMDRIFYVDRDNCVHCTPYHQDLAADEYLTLGVAMSYPEALEVMRVSGAYIVNLLIGRHGEDGHVQGAAGLGSLRGSFGPLLPAALAMSKVHMSHYVRSAHPEVLIPPSLELREGDLPCAAMQVRDRFQGGAIVLKPNSLGTSLFAAKYSVDDLDEDRLRQNLLQIFNYDHLAIAQRFISGSEYSVGCLMVGDEAIALPVVEIRTRNGFFGPTEKFQPGFADEIVVEIESPVVERLKDVSRSIFKSTGFDNMCRFDYIVGGDEKIYFLEANPVPGLMEHSIFPKMLRASNRSVAGMVTQFIVNSKARVEKQYVYDWGSA